MIKFERQYSLKNGNKVNRKNWHQVIAKSLEPCTHVHGEPEIDRAKREDGVYYEQWHLKKEPKGYIFRERYTNSGINGHHKTYREAIWAAINSTRRTVCLPEEGA